MTPYETIEALLGSDVFLVPCAWGTKQPLVTYAKRPFEGTKTPAYRALFDVRPTNIAAYLGRASGGLCAIDLDSDADLDAFLAVNPKLANTTRSRGSRGGMVWVRIVGQGGESTGASGQPTSESGGAPWPASCKTSHFEWRADGNISVIYGRHPKGMPQKKFRNPTFPESGPGMNWTPNATTKATIGIKMEIVANTEDGLGLMPAVRGLGPAGSGTSQVLSVEH